MIRVKAILDLKLWSRPMTIGPQKPQKPVTKARLRAVLAERVVLLSYRGDRLYGRRCDLCDAKCRGRALKHKPECVLA